MQNCDHKDCISVLVADDDPGLLGAIKFAAEARGWCVDQATNAREIIDMVNSRCEERDCCYSAIIADLHYGSMSEFSVPRISGISAAKAIRETYKDIPIVFITGYNTQLIKKDAEKYSNEIMEKPVDLENLLDRVEYYIKIFGSAYKGEERRKRSFNITNNQRRIGDKKVSLNKSLVATVTEARQDLVAELKHNQ